MKKMLVSGLGAIALIAINGCCSTCVCGTKDCTCDCDPCRMGWTHVKCFETYNKQNVVADELKTEEKVENKEAVKEEKKTVNTEPKELKKAETIQKAVNDTKQEAQKTHLKVIPSYVEFVLDYDSLRGVAAMKEKPEKAINIIFTEKDGQVIVAGCSGVNRYFGNVAIKKESNEVKFDKMGSTMMMGPGMDVEKLFLQNLEKAAKYSIVDDKLSFMNANGEILVVFNLKK